MIRTLALVLALSISALAKDNETWDASPAHVRQWFQSLQRPDYPGQSCCGESDAYWADSFAAQGDQYVAIITDEREILGRPPIPVGTRVLVPNEKIKWDRGNPTGHGVIFVRGFLSIVLEVYCYVPPGGG